VENITQFCWKYSSSIQQRKNFENRLRFEKVIGKSLVASFFWDTVYNQLLTLWCPLFPYGYSYEASCARPPG